MSGYPQQLKYFMWPWQVHFRIACQTYAESLFNLLDRELKPEIFLIGFLNESIENRLPICLEPEHLHFDISEFSGVKTIAQDIYNNDPDNSIMYSGPGIQDEMDFRLKKKSIGVALEKIFNESENNIGFQHFVASSTLVDGFEIYIVLALNNEVYNSHIHLKKVDPKERMKLYYSLVEATKDIFLKEMSTSLKLPNPGKSLSDEMREPNEVLREAARKLMHTIGWVGGNIGGVFGLFNTCNKVSIIQYEKSLSQGRLIIAKDNLDLLY